MDRHRTSSQRQRPRFRNQDRGRRYLLPVDLAPVHVFHGVLGLVGGRELHVSVPPPVVRMHVVFGELHVLYDAVRAEYLHDVLAVHGAGQPADMDLRRSRGRRALPSFAPLRAGSRPGTAFHVVLLVPNRRLPRDLVVLLLFLLALLILRLLALSVLSFAVLHGFARRSRRTKRLYYYLTMRYKEYALH